MMMKKITLLALTCFLSVVIHAQQLPQITQYMMNSYVVNPATAGMNDYSSCIVLFVVIVEHVLLR